MATSTLDYLLGYGTLINGHAHPKILQALREQGEKGILFGTPVELEVQLARKFKQMVPSADMGDLWDQRHGCDHERDPHRSRRDGKGHGLEI